MAVSIFISYRREDTLGSTGRIYDRLTAFMDSDRVFIDVDNINPGSDFTEVIADRVSTCDALLAVIGSRWLNIADASGIRRLDDPQDFVRMEIEAALNRNVHVIPILVEGARMPRAEELPTTLRGLARRNALEVSHIRFDADVTRLLRALQDIVPCSEAARLRSLGVYPPKIADLDVREACLEPGLPAVNADQPWSPANATEPKQTGRIVVFAAVTGIFLTLSVGLVAIRSLVLNGASVGNLSPGAAAGSRSEVSRTTSRQTTAPQILPQLKEQRLGSPFGQDVAHISSQGSTSSKPHDDRDSLPGTAQSKERSASVAEDLIRRARAKSIHKNDNRGCSRVMGMEYCD